jgi:hypothetical protein
MKILILGTGKSGTTALVYKIAGGLPNCRAFSGGRPGKYLGNYENAVYKHTYHEGKGKSFELYRQHLDQEHYDRKIWMARDPRDAAVSRMLYRWHRGRQGNNKQYKAHLDLVLKKENDPSCIPFYEICRYTSRNGWPRNKEEFFKEEQTRCERMRDFVISLRDDWFMFRYEDMVTQRLDDLNAYLGFAISADAEVPSGTGKEKVVRKKATGDWRHWFTQEDVKLLKPAYLPYMELIGYDCKDWILSLKPIIEPRYSSMYMQRLAKRGKRFNLFRHIKNLVKRRSKED